MNSAGKESSPIHLRIALVCLSLAFVSLALYARTVQFEFVNFDDNAYVYENPAVIAGLSVQGIFHAFSSGSLANWDPLTTLSHMADCQLYGLWAGGHHLTNVLLHTLSVVLLFLVLRSMTGALWPSAFVAAVFAVHPLHVESVAWVSERKDVLSGLFFMLTLGAYFRYVRKPATTTYLLVLLAFALGLMSKAMLVTVPVILLILDWWPLNRVELGWKKLFLEKTPMLALSLAASALAFVAQSQANAVQSLQRSSPGLRLENSIINYATYLWQSVWPSGLAVYHPFPQHGFPIGEVLGAAAVILAFTVFAAMQRKQRPYLLAGWLWFVVMLLPVIGLVQLGDQARADRYMYLPQIGLAMGLTWWLASLGENFGSIRILRSCLAGLSLSLLAVSAFMASGHWRNGVTLWERALKMSPPSPLVLDNYGTALLQHGRPRDAITQYEATLKIQPGEAMALFNLGDAYVQLGQFPKAIEQYQLALRSEPKDAEAHFKLGILFVNQGRPDEGLPHLQRAVDLDPGNAEFETQLGALWLQLGRYEPAAMCLEHALAINPRLAEAHLNLGTAFLRLGRLTEAVDHLRISVVLLPSDASAHNNFGEALFQSGRMQEAISQFTTAFRLDPRLPAAQDNLTHIAWLLATNPDPSARNGTRALELAGLVLQRPNTPSAVKLAALAAALAEIGRFNEAVEAARDARQLAAQENNTALSTLLDQQLKLYQASQPYRDSGPGGVVPKPGS